ncbi:MAG: tRNA pseudouridine13 synthase [Halobacteriales archaeon]|jgi:tRNA pseudouridine13 synthase
MRHAHPVERAVGIEHYVTDVDGIGGRIRSRPEDFRVTEIERFSTEPVGADRGDYPHLVLRVTLRNWDTNDFAARLSDELGTSRERVSWAGTKDKRAHTTQLFSVRGIEPGELPTIDDADIEVVGRAGRNIHFGDLLGNAFEIVARDVQDHERIEPITDALREFGEAGATGAVGGADDGVTVPNYFGQQRFGSRRPVTHAVGLAIVRDDWQGAVMAYLGNPRETEPEATRTARATIEDLVDDAGAVPEGVDWGTALDATPDRLGYERSMLHALADGGSFRDAIETVPRNLQRLFVHAAQSFLFNRIVSERLERGLPLTRPVAGDVACFADRDLPADADVIVPDTGRVQRVTERRVDSVTRHCERGRAFVTAPLIGTETDLAEGEPGEVERSVLDDVDLDPSDFDLPDPFGSTGDRRGLAVSTRLAVERDPVTFSFALPKGSYATVLLREYLKTAPTEMG